MQRAFKCAMKIKEKSKNRKNLKISKKQVTREVKNILKVVKII